MCHAVRAVSKAVLRRLERMEYTQARHTGPVIVRFPGYLGLKVGLFRHQLASLAAMRRAEYPTAPIAYGTLRGGVLGDAPGLGKSVTCLAHVLASAGESPMAAEEFWDRDMVRESWRALGTSSSAASAVRPDLLRGLRRLVAHRDSYTRGSEPWRTVNELLDKAQQVGSFDSPDELERFVRLSVSRLLRHATPATRDSIISDFAHACALTKARLDRSRRAALRRQGETRESRLLAERLARPSGATLVVVPDALLGHWRRMIEKHVCFEQLAQNYGNGRGRGLFFVEGFGDASTWIRSSDDDDYQSSATGPVRYSKDTLRLLPPADELRGYLAVVISFSLCSREACREASRRRADKLEYARYGHTSEADQTPLLQLRWLRLVVDEGHDLGSATAPTYISSQQEQQQQQRVRGAAQSSDEDSGQLDENASAILSTLFAERRWILSGTPVVGDVDDVNATRRHLEQLNNLLRWLRHERYGIDKDPGLDKETDLASARRACHERWEVEVARPFLNFGITCATEQGTALQPPLERQIGGSCGTARNKSSFEDARRRLVDLLRGIFVRHRKEDITLPKPVFVNTELAVAPQTDGESNDEYAWRIDQKLGEYVVKRVAQEAKRVASGVPKIAVFSQNDADLQSVAEVLYQHLGETHVAEFAVRNLGPDIASRELARFASGRRLIRDCPVCHGTNDADEKRICARTLLEVEVLNEAVVGARQDAIDAWPDLLAGPRSAERMLIEPERVVRVASATHPDVDGADGVTYAKNYRAWTVGDEIIVSLEDTSPALSRRPGYDQWIRWGAARCELLAARHDYQSAHWYFAPILNGVRNATARCRLRKWGKCGHFHGVQWYRGPSLITAPVRSVREDVQILCIYRDASHGLDLSFLDVIFLLEPVRDSALLEQVVSRAYRVGAIKPVIVETLHVFIDPEAQISLTPKRKKKKINHRRTPKTKPDFNYICVSISICQIACPSLRRTAQDHCFKSFKSEPEADAHMLTCSRNPDMRGKRAARHTIASIFDELRPPLGDFHDNFKTA